MDESDTLKQVYDKFGELVYVREYTIVNHPVYQAFLKTTCKTDKIKEEGLRMLTETLKSLCIDNCKDGVGCYRLFTCDSWPNSKLYAVGPKKIWFDRYGQPKVKDSGNYDLSVCESYCNRKRNPWREVKTLEEVKKLYV
jgi:hypothetical protein